MKKRFIIIYTIFASLFMISSISYMSYNLYKEFKQGESRSASIFANTVFNLYSTLPGLDESQKNYYSKISSSINDLNDFAFIDIKNNNNSIYTYPLGTNKNTTSSKFTKYYETEIEINDNIFILNCNIFKLKPYSIFYYSRLAFFMILGITLLTIILIICQKNNTNQIQQNSYKIPKEPQTDDKITSENNSKSTNENYSEQETADFSPSNKTDEGNDEPSSDDLNIVEQIEDSIDKNNNDDLILNKNDEPEGLFSTTTGLGWESYLNTRLENEINRSISTEMDLSIFIIQISNLDKHSELCKKICNYLIDQFRFRDLLFEYKDDCIVAIETGANIDDALVLGEKIHTDIMNFLNNTDTKCYIGISSRSVRMISSEHFLKEAEEALLHAKEDESSPIIAFRADIDKYRKYLEQKFDD